MNEYSFIFAALKIRDMRTRDIKKEKLVREKAVSLLVKEGFEGFSMQKLAKACTISVATLYIYYKNKESLLLELGAEEGKKMTAATLKNFSPDLPFAEGLRIQWENRANYWLKNPKSGAFFEALKHSPYGDCMLDDAMSGFRNTMKAFVHNAVKRKELKPLPIEVYWSVAFGPLFTLIRFHHEGKSMGGKPFKFNKTTMEQTFQLVLQTLQP